ncbi:DUF423 domain-containing protein [Alteromonas sp. H39]|uniref:DUF423 domain-containing protein n=1 Tax=Alteromonas sp. H39 TaxID=3389876 RepID=UPI0039DFB2BC
MQTVVVVAAFSALTAVMLGAFGAHGLKGVLSASELNTFEIAVRYQMYHGLAMLVLPVLTNVVARPWLRRAAIAFGVGIVLFSGSLYLLIFTGSKWFGPVTPLGGVAFMVGWIMLVVGVYKYSGAGEHHG